MVLMISKLINFIECLLNLNSAWVDKKNMLPFAKHYKQKSKTKDNELREAIEEALEESKCEKVFKRNY
jgi:hypothetical protein